MAQVTTDMFIGDSYGMIRDENGISLIRYPVILKPAGGGGGIGATLMLSRNRIASFEHQRTTEQT